MKRYIVDLMHHGEFVRTFAVCASNAADARTEAGELKARFCANNGYPLNRVRINVRRH